MKKTITFLIAFVTLAFSSGVFAQVMPALSSADNSNEHWYYLKCYRENGKVVLDNASHQGGTWDVNNLSSFRKFKVVKDAENDTYGIVYKSGETYLYLQKGGSDTDTDVSFTETAFTGFTFTEALTTASAQTGQAIAGLPALRISRSATGFLHMKVTGGGFGLRFYNEIEDANLFVFFTGKTQLLENITLATNRLTNTVEGEGPGEFPTAARTTLSGAISAAQNVYDNVASTEADMFTATATLNDAIMTYRKAKIMPFTLSDGSNTHWYFIRNLDTGKPRSELAIKFSAENAVAQSTNFYTGVLPTMWKVVTNADVSSYGLVCNIEGVDYYINNEMKLTTTPFTSWTLTSGTVTSVTGWRFEYKPAGVTTAVIHQTNTDGYNLMSNWLGADIASLWRFETLSSMLLLNASVLDNTVAGENPGTFPTGARATLQGIVNNALLVVNNEASSKEDVATAFTDVRTAVATYKTTMILPQLSTEGNDIWYFFQGTRPANTYLTSKGAGAALRSEAVIPDDTQLWKIVANTNGTANGVALVNKVTGEYVNANAANNTDVSSVATMPTNNLQIKLSDIYTNKTARFWVEHSAGSTPAFRLHAGNGNVMNWTGNAYDNSSWMIVSYSSALKGFLETGIDNATALVAAAAEGTDFGLASSADKNTLNSAISTAEGVYTNATATETEILNATVAINAANASFKAAVADYNKLLSTNTENYKWYWIRSNATAAPDRLNKVISQGVRANGAKFTFEDKITPGTDAQLFRFVVNGDNSKVLHIINKAGKFMASDGAIATASTPGNDFALNLLSDGVSFNIKPSNAVALHAQQDGAHIVNWPGDAGSASAWVFDFAEETEKGAARTVTVTSNLLQGSAVITGTELTTISSSDAISVTATALENYYFVNWTNTDGDAVVSTANPYSYTGTEDISLTANFATNGVAVAPMVWTEENKTYYYIYSAADGSKALGDAPHNLRPYCLLSPSSADGVKLTWGLPTEGDDNDLWVLTEVEEVLKLRNVATGKYLTGSDTQNATGAEVFVTAYAEPNATQYKIGNTGINPIIAWNSNTADKYSDQGVNSKTAWYFVAGTPTGPISSLELNNDSKFSVYALNGQIHISSPSAETLDIAVYSIAGQNLYRTRSNNQSVVLDKNFESGAYIVKINQTITKVMVK